MKMEDIIKKIDDNYGVKHIVHWGHAEKTIHSKANARYNNIFKTPRWFNLLNFVKILGCFLVMIT